MIQPDITYEYVKHSRIKEMSKIANAYEIDISKTQSIPIYNRLFGIDALLNKWNNVFKND